MSLSAIFSHVRRQPLELAVLPTVNLALAVIFWTAQSVRYQSSVEGVLYGWIILGMLFVFVQLSLFPGAWRDSAQRSEADRFGARWLLGSQVVFCAGVLIYTCITLVAMGQHHARLVPYDAAISAAALAVLLPAIVQHRRNLGGPEAKLAYATAFKVAPQYVQAVALVAIGVGGVSAVSLGALISIVGLRFLISRATHRRGANQYTKVTLVAATRDWWSALVMAVCWGVGAALR